MAETSGVEEVRPSLLRIASATSGEDKLREFGSFLLQWRDDMHSLFEDLRADLRHSVVEELKGDLRRHTSFQDSLSTVSDSFNSSKEPKPAPISFKSLDLPQGKTVILCTPHTDHNQVSSGEYSTHSTANLGVYTASPTAIASNEMLECEILGSSSTENDLEPRESTFQAESECRGELARSTEVVMDQFNPFEDMIFDVVPKRIGRLMVLIEVGMGDFDKISVNSLANSGAQHMFDELPIRGFNVKISLIQLGCAQLSRGLSNWIFDPVILIFDPGIRGYLDSLADCLSGLDFFSLWNGLKLHSSIAIACDKARR